MWAQPLRMKQTATRNIFPCFVLLTLSCDFHQLHFPALWFSEVFPALSISEIHFPRRPSVTFSRAFHKLHFPALSISYVFPRFSALRLFCVLSSDWVRRALSDSVIGYMVTVMLSILCYVTSRMLYESIWITKLDYITYAAVDNLHLFCYSVRRVFIKKGEVRFWPGMIFFHFSYQHSMQFFCVSVVILRKALAFTAGET